MITSYDQQSHREAYAVHLLMYPNNFAFYVVKLNCNWERNSANCLIRSYQFIIDDVGYIDSIILKHS